MSDWHSAKILARLAPPDFVGRTLETETVLRHARNESGARGLLILSAPKAGASELLLQIYDRIFREQENLIPFYFALDRNDKTAAGCAVRFLQTFLQQAIAYCRNDAELLKISLDACELEELAAPAADAPWIHQLVAACRKESVLNDERAFIRRALSAPLRAAAGKTPVFVMIDDLHHAENFLGGASFIEELKEIYARASVKFVLAGRRRFVQKAMRGGDSKLDDAKILRLDAGASAEILIENSAKRFGVETSEQARDLIGRQFGGNLSFVEAVFAAARERETDLQSFQAVEQIYIDELFGGRIGRFYDEQFSDAAPNAEMQKQIVKLLNDAFAAENGKIPADVWRERLALAAEEFDKIMRRLHVGEIVNYDFDSIKIPAENEILKDYAAARARLEISGEQRAAVVGDMLKNSLVRAPVLMTRAYRRAAAIGLRELMTVFNCQSVQTSLIDYALFKENLKGAEASEIVEKLQRETERIKLPQIVYAANGAAFYPPISQVADDEQCAVAFGFEQADYRRQNEIVWVAAEIESKLEASRELTEFWCDRLEMVALMCNFLKYQFWLVAPEGFSPEAIEVLRRRKVYNSSRRQIELLVKHLHAEKIVGTKTAASEYEMILPMGDDTELIAASAVEEIARRHNFPPKAIAQIKTALVEACINAAEHSLSPDRKIHQKITVEDDRLIITVSNRGIKIAPEKIDDAAAAPVEPNEGRRGWGLKLMRALMDEVKFEQTDDGTQISMVKYLR